MSRVAVSVVVASCVVAGCQTVTPSVQPNGKPLGTASHMENVEGRWDDNERFIAAHERLVFDHHLQGDEQIDELDYFAIAGDKNAVNKIVKYRNGFNFAVLLGSPVTALGAAGLVTAGVTYAVSDNRSSETFTDTQNGQIVLVSAIAGSTAMLAGLGLFYYLLPSIDHNEPTDFVLSYKRASEAAETYNATLSE